MCSFPSISWPVSRIFSKLLKKFPAVTNFNANWNSVSTRHALLGRPAGKLLSHQGLERNGKGVFSPQPNSADADNFTTQFFYCLFDCFDCSTSSDDILGNENFFTSHHLIETTVERKDWPQTFRYLTLKRFGIGK